MSVACTSCGHKHDDWVPKERLDAVSAKLQTATAEAATKAAEVAAAAAAGAEAGETLAQAQARIAELETSTGALTQERSIIRSGIVDDEGIGVVRALYSALPEDQRPASVGEWLESGSLPRAVLAYLPTAGASAPAAPAPVAGAEAPPAAAAAPAEDAAPAPAPVGAPGSNGIVHGQPSASGAVDLKSMPLEQLRATMAKLRRVGG